MNPQQAPIDTAKDLLKQLDAERELRKAAKADYKTQKRAICNMMREAENELARLKLVNGNTVSQLKQHIAKIRVERRAAMRSLRKQWQDISAVYSLRLKSRTLG